MSRSNNYNGGLTREQFLFYEIRIVAKLVRDGESREDILSKLKEENLFQFPTERMISSIDNACFKRIDALDSDALVEELANGSMDVAKQMIPMSQHKCDYFVMVPQGNIRFKSGGGQNYVHGGTSLQEMMVPVITFKNMRSLNKKFVEVSKAKIELISSGRKISNSIFSLDFYQKEPVGGKVDSCTYSVFFTDASGNTVSDVQTIIANKTSDNGSDRVFRVRFTLKAIEFRKTDDYYLTIIEKDNSGIPEKTAFTIDIAFASDFDF